MQRRAAAMYFAFFVIVGAAAYGLLATSTAPQVSLDAPTYGADDDVALGDRTYTVSDLSAESSGEEGDVEVTGELAWVNESAEASTQLDNGSSLSPVDVVWEGQQARHVTTVENGATISHEGGQYDLSINASVPSLTLTNTANASQNSTYESGDTLDYRGNESTVTDVTSDAVTLVWGNSYRVDVPNVTNMENVSTPSNVTFVEERNVTALAAQDPALYNQTVTIDGVEQVTFREDNRSVPVVEYFDTVDTATFEVGDSLDYQGNETTISSISVDAVTLTWPGTETNTLDLSEAGEFTAQGTSYFAHFPNNNTVQVLPYDQYWTEYNATQQRIDSYDKRKAGLWGITELSILAAIILLGTAYLPVRG